MKIIDIFKTTNVYNRGYTPSDFTANVNYLFTKYFDVNYQAYVIHISDQFNIINMDALQFYKVYTLIVKGDCDFYISY